MSAATSSHFFARVFLVGSATLSAAPLGCAPVGDLEETDTTVGELSATTLKGVVVAYSTTTGSNTAPRQSFGPGVYVGSELAGVGDDATRLLEIAPAVRVRVCQHATPSRTTCSTFENLTGTNRLVSVAAGTSRIEVRPLVVAYRNANFGGVAQGFEIGRHDTVARIAVIGNDTITSLRIAPGVRVRACSDDPFLTVGGTCGVFEGNISRLTPLDNSISWLEVVPVTAAFRGANFTGVIQNFLGGTFPVNALNVLGNDTLSSIAVPEGVVTRTCSDDPTNTIGFTCVTFTKSSLQVPAAIDNQTSWIDSSQNVIRDPCSAW